MGSAAAREARAEIRERLRSSPLPRSEHKAVEREWVSLAMTIARQQQLEARDAATTHDQAIHLRAVARLDKLRARVSPEAPPEPPKAAPLDATDRRAFCERHLTVADGGPYSLEGREWQQREVWDVLDGYKLWPADRTRLCGGCAPRAGRIVRSVYETVEPHGDCAGLRAHVVWLVALQLKRQQGKTAGFAGYAVSSLAARSHESIAYIAGSEDQTAQLFRVNFGSPVKGSPTLAEHFDVGTVRMVCKGTGSEFEIRPTSLAGTTGGSRTLVGVDEARDVPSAVFAAFVPQIYARNGWRCPTAAPGHAWSSGDLVLLEGGGIDPAQPQWGRTCTTCGARLEPWSGRVLAMSSAQELDGSDADWFHDLCEHLQGKPQPDAHVYRTAQIVNPKVSSVLVGRTEAVLGEVRGLRDAIAVEAGGMSKRRGEPFLSEADLLAVEDRSLVSRDSGVRPAVGFLDTSDVTDLTTLVIVEDDGGAAPWERIVEAHLQVWVPSEQPGGFIDDRVIEEHLELVLPRFAVVPGALCIDDRRRPWAKLLLQRMRLGPFAHLVRGCDTKGEKWGGVERRLAWSKVHERIKRRTCRLIADPRQHEELRGARRFDRTDGDFDVHETNRRVNHLDVAEAFAGCCLLVHEQSATPRRPGLAAIERHGARGVVAQVQSRRPLAPARGDY